MVFVVEPLRVAHQLSTRRKIALAVVPTLLVALALEIALRFSSPTTWLSGDDLDEYVFYLDRNGRLAEIEDYEKLYRLGRFPWNLHSPELGWINRPHFRSAGVTFNSDGMRGTRDLSLAKRPNERRIVVVGDSFAFGFEVADQETFSQRLEDRLGVPVLNMGVRGYGTDQAYLTLKERGFRYSPDVAIVSVFYPHNIERNGRAFYSYSKPRFTLIGDELVLGNVPVPAPEVLKTRPPSLFRSRLYGFLRNRARRGWQMRVGLTPQDARDVRVTLAILDTILRDCDERRVELVVLLIPPSAYPRRRGENEKAIEGALLGWGERTRVPVVDMWSRFSALPLEHRKIAYGTKSHHWTPLAHDLCAQALEETILEKGLLPLTANE